MAGGISPGPPHIADVSATQRKYEVLGAPSIITPKVFPRITRSGAAFIESVSAVTGQTRSIPVRIKAGHATDNRVFFRLCRKHPF
jgi:hypothetical protein